MPHPTACRSLVVPLGPSADPAAALAAALRLAAPDGADLYLLHVAQPGRPDADRRAALTDLRMAYRHGLAARSRVGLHLAVIRAPDAAAGIAAFARSVRCDVLVLPTRGVTRPVNAERDVLAGLIACAPCPVVTAPARSGAPLRLLLPSAPTEAQRAAAHTAAQWTGLTPTTPAPRPGAPFFVEPTDLFVTPPGLDALALIRSQACACWVPPPPAYAAER